MWVLNAGTLAGIVMSGCNRGEVAIGRRSPKVSSHPSYSALSRSLTDHSALPFSPHILPILTHKLTHPSLAPPSPSPSSSSSPSMYTHTKTTISRKSNKASKARRGDDAKVGSREAERWVYVAIRLFFGCWVGMDGEGNERWVFLNKLRGVSIV